MRCRLAITTINDILMAIGRREEYDTKLLDDGTLLVEAYPYVLKIKQNSPMFHWVVEAVDDPTDRDEGYSSTPTQDIVDFVKGDVPGGSMLDKYAAEQLRRMAAAILAGRCRPADVAAELRRVASRVRMADTGVSALIDLHRVEMKHLADQMTGKGWRIQEFKDDSSLPAIEFEIGERYTGKLMLHDVIYDYEFAVEGEPSVTKSGTTNDLEQEFRAWARSDAVDSAREAAPDPDTKPIAAPGPTGRP